MAPTIAIIAAGNMGAPLAHILTRSKCRVLTDLSGRSAETVRRAGEAGMQCLPLSEIVESLLNEKDGGIFLSVVPPKDAEDLARRVQICVEASTIQDGRLIYVEGNAINPRSVRSIRDNFNAVSGKVSFIDGSILGYPPTDQSTPTLYISSDPSDQIALHHVAGVLSKHGLTVKILEDGGVGAASGLKMSYGGLAKGITGLMTAMILGGSFLEL